MIYKPTGPDGKGWGEFRQLSPEDIQFFEEMKRNETEKISKQTIQITGKSNFIVDADELWEKQFEEIVTKQKEEEIESNELLSKKRQMKKMKKEIKKEKKNEKKMEKEKKRVDELKKLYKSYGIDEIKEHKSNIIDE
jgi:hypothetical protein